MNVIIVDNHSSNLRAAKENTKGKIVTVEMDVSKIEDFEKLKVMVERDFEGSYFQSSQLQHLSISCRLTLTRNRENQPSHPQRRDRS